jgi:hypothetical protein
MTTGGMAIAAGGSGGVVNLAGTLARAGTCSPSRKAVRALAPLSGAPRVNAPTEAPLRVTTSSAPPATIEGSQ